MSWFDKLRVGQRTPSKAPRPAAPWPVQVRRTEDFANCKVGGTLAAMPSIAFTRHLEAVGPTDVRRYDAATVRELLEAAGAEFPRLRSYVLDDQGRLRKHIAVFIDGAMVERTTALARAVDDTSEVYVFQALSGG